MTANAVSQIVNSSAGDINWLLGSICLILVSLVAYGVRQIVTGRLVPASSVEQMISDRAQRIAEQSTVIDMAKTVAIENSGAIKSLSDSVDNFAQAQILNVHLVDALRSNLPLGGSRVPTQEV